MLYRAVALLLLSSLLDGGHRLHCRVVERVGRGDREATVARTARQGRCVAGAGGVSHTLLTNTVETGV